MHIVWVFFEISKRVVEGDNVHYSPEVDTLEEAGSINSNH